MKKCVVIIVQVNFYAQLTKFNNLQMPIFLHGTFQYVGIFFEFTSSTHINVSVADTDDHST